MTKLKELPAKTRHHDLMGLAIIVGGTIGGTVRSMIAQLAHGQLLAEDQYTSAARRCAGQFRDECQQIHGQFGYCRIEQRDPLKPNKYASLKKKDRTWLALS
jgi:hypothetical protein